MNFGEIRTTVYAALPQEWQEKISVFEFGEAIDDAQRLFAMVLPSDTIPELVIEKFIDTRTDLNAKDIFPLPDDYLKVESVQFAQTRDANDVPNRRDARLVKPKEFEELKNIGSTEFIACVFNNLLQVSPPATDASAGNPAALKMVYRKRPRPYTTTAGVLKQAARVDLQQLQESRHSFRAFDYGAGPASRSWDYWGLDVNELPGGFVYMGGSTMDADTKAPLYIMRIVQAWEELGVGYLRVSSDDEVPIDDENASTGFTFPYCYVAQRPVYGYSGSAVEAEDHEFPDIGANWHHLVCRFAIAKLEERFNPESAKVHMAAVYQTLTGAGARLDITKGG